MTFDDRGGIPYSALPTLRVVRSKRYSPPGSPAWIAALFLDLDQIARSDVVFILLTHPGSQRGISLDPGDQLLFGTSCQATCPKSPGTTRSAAVKPKLGAEFAQSAATHHRGRMPTDKPQ